MYVLFQIENSDNDETQQLLEPSNTIEADSAILDIEESTGNEVRERHLRFSVHYYMQKYWGIEA